MSLSCRSAVPIQLAPAQPDQNGCFPTQESQDLNEKCKAIAEKFKEAETLILHLDDVPRGKLKIALRVAFAKSQLMPALPRFLEETRNSRYHWVYQTGMSNCKVRGCAVTLLHD